MAKIGMTDIKIRTTLYGYDFGMGTKRHGDYHEFEIAKVGRDYVYDKYDRKIRLVLNKDQYPQFDTLIAQDEDLNHRYNYFLSPDGASKGLKVSRLRVELSTNKFRQQSDEVILKIAELMGLV